VNYRPFVSVVIPTFNRAKQVQAALKSVLAQTYPDFEVIVVDDGSTDGTEEAIQRLIDQQSGNGNQIRYFFQPNRGPSVARNKGIAEGRGVWVAFLDSDDVWLPEKLEWQFRAVEEFEGKICACITDSRLINNLGKDTTAFRQWGRRFEKTLGIVIEATATLATCREPFWLSNLLVRTDLVQQVGSYDADLSYAEDHDFLFRLSLATRFCYVNKPLCVIDQSKSLQGSICRPWDKVDVRLRGSQLMLEKWLKLDTKLPPDVRTKLVRQLGHIHSAWTNWYLEDGRYEEARREVSRAIAYQFKPTLGIKWALTRFAPALARRISPRMRVTSGQ